MNTRFFIIDTNVVAAGLITAAPKSPTARILDAMLAGRLFFILSAKLLKEYREVLLRPKLTRHHGLDQSHIDQLLTEITANAIWREPPPETDPAAPDPKDSHLWELLLSEADTVLVTGDRLLIDNPGPRSSIISPATWAKHFAECS